MYKLLIADDEEIEINAFRIMIGNNFDDVTVLAAYNGVEAVVAARAEKPDIVFMDIEMPGLDGLSVIEELKSEAPDTRFIVHTAYNNFEYAQKAVKLGADDYLLKPVKMQALIDVIRANIECVEKRRTETLESQQLAQRLSNLKPFIERDIVSSVVNGVEGHEILTRYADMFDFHMKRVFCAIFRIADVPGAKPAPDKPALCKHAAALSVVDTLKSVCRCIASEYVSGSVLAIIPFDEPPDEGNARTWSLRLVNYVCNSLRDTAAVRAGIGGLTTLEHIHTSYYEAYRTLSDYVPDVSVMHHDDLVRGEEHPEDVWRCETELGKLIIARKSAQALEEAQTLFGLIMLQDKTVDGLKGKLMESCAVIKRFIESNTTEGFTIAGGDLGLMADMMGYDALKRYLCGFVESAVAQISALSEKRGSVVIREVRMYIEENFAKEITLENVAASVCVTPYYLSRLFKKKTGENFNTYLTQVRIEEAKRLFRGTDKSIKAVAYDTGFNSQAYFYRVFKRVEGISPSEFILNLKK